MAFVGLFLSAIAVMALEVSGGAARDTSIVVCVAAVAITDFWAGGLMRAITKHPFKPNLVCWLVVRSMWFLLAALVIPALVPVVGPQLALAALAFALGARFASAQQDRRGVPVLATGAAAPGAVHDQDLTEAEGAAFAPPGPTEVK
jgi:hypothetical protein